MKKIFAFILALTFIVSAFSMFSISAATVDMENYFTDVVVNSWYEDGVLYCYKYGYMSGVGEAVFNPNGNCTRAMFATVLYNISMATDTYSSMSFKDVPLNTWYSNPVEWAFKNEYTYGVAEGYFAPNNNLSRQELVTLLYRYHLANNENVVISGNVSSFKDAAAVSDWATEALNWAIGEGVISGFEDGSLRPKGLVTRAQLARILKGYLEVYGIKWESETVQTERTCTTDGVTVFYDADTNISKTVVYKAWHTYRIESITQKYDCIYGEKAKYKCVDCGDTKVEVSRKGSGKHKWDNGKVTREPDYFDEGEMLYTCKTCGGTYTKKIPKIYVTDALIGNWYCDTLYDYKWYTDTIIQAYEKKLDSPITITITKDGKLTYKQGGKTIYYTCKYKTGDPVYDIYQVLDSSGKHPYLLYYKRGKSILYLDKYNVQDAYYFKKK